MPRQMLRQHWQRRAHLLKAVAPVQRQLGHLVARQRHALARQYFLVAPAALPTTMPVAVVVLVAHPAMVALAALASQPIIKALVAVVLLMAAQLAALAQHRLVALGVAVVVLVQPILVSLAVLARQPALGEVVALAHLTLVVLAVQPALFGHKHLTQRQLV
jgi:hypothetical protein